MESENVVRSVKGKHQKRRGEGGNRKTKQWYADFCFRKNTEEGVFDQAEKEWSSTTIPKSKYQKKEVVHYHSFY